MRVIIYTGKGGVGKTSMAAATACKIAKNGKKVLVMSTDQAHSLGDSFECKIGKEPTQLADNLYAMEIDTVYESEKSWGNLKDYFKKLLTLKGGSGIEAEELLVFPGLEELFSMFKILEVYESGEYDTIIVDCAPTGETLALLKYPERLSGMLKRILPVKRAAVKSVGTVVENVMKIPMPEDNVFDDIEYLMDKMQRLQELMLNKEVVSLRVVTTPEKIVMNEAKRNFTCLYLYHYNVDAVIVNHIYPAKAMEGYFNKWMKLQEDALQEIKESFSEVPRFYVELQQQELRTFEVLEKVGEIVFAGVSPDDVLFKKEIYSIDNEETCLKIYLPFAEKEELRLEQDKNELVVGVGNESRKFPVPVEFAEKEIAGAKFEDGYLKIGFRTAEEDVTGY
ncbi:MAG: ArsA family ATPase [Lachnospiraceae bacterium]|nr:ArsA family ATPase [Lachnospiraceae bacterium]